jgi:hypothetical protein
MMRPSKKLAKIDTAIGAKMSKGDIQETIDKVDKATKKLGNLYGEYGRGRLRYK